MTAYSTRWLFQTCIWIFLYILISWTCLNAQEIFLYCRTSIQFLFGLELSQTCYYSISLRYGSLWTSIYVIHIPAHTPPQCRCHERSQLPKNNMWRDKEGKMPQNNNGGRRRVRCKDSMHFLKFNILLLFTSLNSQLWENSLCRFNKKNTHNFI